MLKRIRAVVIGTVQGVGYRYFAMSRAKGKGVVGYVKNLSNGNVEVVAEGEQGDLEDYIELLKRGPFGAHVKEVVVVWLAASGEFYDFKVQH